MKRKDYKKPAIAYIWLQHQQLLASSVNYDTTIDSTMPDYGDPENLIWD